MIADLPPIIINEVAWMGTKDSAYEEWIELRNTTDLPINLEGWTLKAADSTPRVQLARNVLANGFCLLERSKDYTGALNNKGEKLELYDNLGNLIDLVDASAGWPAGDNSTKQTMERKDAQNWQTSQNPGGTPKAENSEVVEVKLQQHLQNELQPSQIEELAAAGEAVQPTQTTNVSFTAPEALTKQAARQIPVFIALATAVFSGIMILVLKRKLNHQKEI